MLKLLSPAQIAAQDAQTTRPEKLAALNPARAAARRATRQAKGLI